MSFHVNKNKSYTEVPYVHYPNHDFSTLEGKSSFLAGCGCGEIIP